MSNPTKRNIMEIVVNARLHVVNGTNYTVSCPELHGEVFQSPKEKEKYRRRITEEMIGAMQEDTPEEKKGYLQFETVTLPDGQSQLPADWKIEPIPLPAKPTPEQPVSFELIDVKSFVPVKPKFMVK